LEDEFSAQFAEIVEKLDQFKRSLDEVSKKGAEGFKRVADNVKEVGDRGTGVNAQLSSMRTHMTDAFLNLNRSLAGTVQGLGSMEGRLATIGSNIVGLGEKLGPLGRALGGIAGGAAAAGGAIWLLGRHLTQTFKDMQNLQIQLGMSEASITTFERAFARFNKGPEDAHRALSRFNDAIEETSKLAGSTVLRNMREGIAGAGAQIAAETDKIFSRKRHGEITTEEAFREWMQRVYGIQPEAVRRRLARYIGESFEDLEQLRRHLPQVITPTTYSKPMEEALENLNKTIHDQMEKISNAWVEEWNKMGPGEIEKINTAIAKMGEALRALIPIISQEFGKAMTDMVKIMDEIKGWVEWWNKTPLQRIQEHQKAQEEDPNQQGGNWFQRWWDRFKKSKGIGDQPAGTPQRFGGWGGADMSGIAEESKAALIDKIMTPENIARGSRHIEWRTGDTSKTGEPIRATAAGEDLRRMGGDIRESTEYLRDIRDIMKWLQDQLQGQGANAPSGAGGAGSGLGSPGQFGGGGGGTGARTGSPWFGGRAGRGTGGPPEIGQGGPGAGADFYQKALTAVKGSGLVGQVPKDGAQFGITTGSAEEWARFMTATAKAESNFNPRSANTSDPGGSFGVLQYAHGQVPGGNAYNTDASIQAFIRDSMSSTRAGSLRGGILGQRFSTIGRHPERTIRNLANYGDSTQGGPQAPMGPSGSGQVRDYGGGHIGGNIDVGGQVFRFGSGGSLPHIPYGTYPVTPEAIGSWGRAHGALGINQNRIWDASLGRYRQGIEFHAASSEAAITAGCIAIAGGQYPQFKQRVLAMIRQHGSAYLHIGPGGASVTPGRTSTPESRRASGHVGGDTTAHPSQGPAAAEENERAGRPFWMGRAGRHQPLGAQTHELRGTADVNVNIRHPHGTSVTSSANGSGVLGHPRVKTSRTGQMRSAGQNAVSEANRYGEE